MMRDVERRLRALDEDGEWLLVVATKAHADTFDLARL